MQEINTKKKYVCIDSTNCSERFVTLTAVKLHIEREHAELAKFFKKELKQNRR